MSARLLATASALLATVAAHAATGDDYAYAWPLQTQGDSAAWQVELTPEVYAAVTRADLRDVEIVNAAGDAVPIAPRALPAAARPRDELMVLPLFVLPAKRETRSDDNEAIHLHIERGSDGKLHSLDADVGGPGRPIPVVGGAHATATVAANAAVPADNRPSDNRDVLLDASAIRDPLVGVRILWNQSGGNETAQFALSASDDLQQWRSLVANASVLHLMQDGNVLDRHDVAFATTHAAYLRLRRLDDGSGLTGVVVQARIAAHSTIEQPALQWLQATPDGGDTQHIDRTTLPPADGTAIAAYRYHLPAPLAPEAIRIALADDNSLARVSVISRAREPYDQPSSWMQRKSAIAFRLRQDDASIDNDAFDMFPGGRARDWRIETATPLAHAPVLSVGYRPDRFVFLAQGAGPYRLVAGSARAQRGDYPLDSALAPLRAKLGSDWQPPLAALGARETLQGERALNMAPPPIPARDWRTWLLWAVLVGAAALIGGLALSLLRKPPNP